MGSLTFPLSFGLNKADKTTFGLTSVVKIGNVYLAGGGVASPIIFNLPLTDAGSGIVNTTPTFAAGSATATFTRASVAWTKLSSGLWAQIASGSARSCYTGQDTAVGTYGGYLSEPAATQLVTPTASIRDMTDASWVKVNATAAKNATGIDGVANSASTLTATSNGGTVLQTLVAAASARTFSAFVRRKTGTGTITIQQGATTLDVTAQLNSTTYTRVTLNASVLNAAFGFIFGTNADAIEVDFNQFEANPFGPAAMATSPMASAGAARAIDDLSYVATGNVVDTTGTFYTEVFINANTGSEMSFCRDFNNSSRLGYITGANTTSIACNDSTTTVTKSGLTDYLTGIRKRASSWGALGLRATGDGAAPATGVFDGTMLTVDNLIFGQSLNGMIKNVLIYNTQLSDAALSALTA